MIRLRLSLRRSLPLIFFTACLCAGMVSTFAGVAGSGTLSGLVTAAKPFTLAQVYAKDLDKNMLYVVYTSNGRYQFVNLMPGNYEIWAEKQVPRSELERVEIAWSPTMGATKAAKVLRSEVKKIAVGGDRAGSLDLALAVGDGGKVGSVLGGASTETVDLVSYDQLYPAGPGRDIAEKKCMVCHSQDFFAGHRKTAAQWDEMIGVMLNPDARRGAMLQADAAAGTINAHERQVLAEYLGNNFGPDSRPRALKVDAEYPVDEQALSKAMFIEYLLPMAKKAGDPKYKAQDPHLDNDGNIWFTNALPGVSRLDPRTARFTHFPYPETKIFGHGLTVDSKGSVFWSEFSGFHLGRLDPSTGKMDRFPMDPDHVVRNGNGHTPVLDSKEDIWFTVITGNRIGHWTRKTGNMRLWEIPTANSFPYGILVDHNDKIWFAELNGGKIGMFDPKVNEFKEYPTLTQPSKIRRLGVDSKGIIWYGMSNVGKLGRLDPKTGKQTEYDVMPNASDSRVIVSEPYEVIADHEDQIWIGDDGLGGALIKFNPQTEKFTYYPLPRQSDTPRMDLTREGGLVYTTRSNPQPAIGILYPDVSKMTTYAAYR